MALLAGSQQIISVFAFNLPKKFLYEKAPNTLRILQWNVSGWDMYSKNNFGKTYFPLMLNLIQKENPDIMCFEEYYDRVTKKHYQENLVSLTNLGYPYHYFVTSDSIENVFKSGIAIFSRYPMIDSANFSFKKSNDGEHLLYTDIKVDDTIFRVFATHLQSVHFVGRDYQSLSKMKKAEETSLHESRTLISKLKKGYISRYKQAELVEEKIKESPYPSFICGDFNDVPNSSTYFKIKGNLQDAFLQKGFLLGRTFRFISPTLRIDYILANKKFKVMQYHTIKVPYSDHYPVVADLQY